MNESNNDSYKYSYNFYPDNNLWAKYDKYDEDNMFLMLELESNFFDKYYG